MEKKAYGHIFRFRPMFGDIVGQRLTEITSLNFQFTKSVHKNRRYIGPEVEFEKFGPYTISLIFSSLGCKKTFVDKLKKVT